MEHLAITGATLGGRNSGRGSEGATGIKWMEARAAVKHSTTYRTRKNYLPGNVNKAEVEKSCYNLTQNI